MTPETREAYALFQMAHERYQEALQARIKQSQAHLARLRADVKVQDA